MLGELVHIATADDCIGSCRLWFSRCMLRDTTNQSKGSDHEGDYYGTVARSHPVYAAVCLRDVHDARYDQFRCVQVDDSKPAMVVLAIRLQLHDRRIAGDMLAGGSMPEFGQLPARVAVTSSRGSALTSLRGSRLSLSRIRARRGRK